MRGAHSSQVEHCSAESVRVHVHINFNYLVHHCILPTKYCMYA